jgi:hypothetical protein
MGMLSPPNAPWSDEDDSQSSGLNLQNLIWNRNQDKRDATMTLSDGMTVTAEAKDHKGNFGGSGLVPVARKFQENSNSNVCVLLVRSFANLNNDSLADLENVSGVNVIQLKRQSSHDDIITLACKPIKSTTTTTTTTLTTTTKGASSATSSETSAPVAEKTLLVLDLEDIYPGRSQKATHK